MFTDSLYSVGIDGRIIYFNLQDLDGQSFFLHNPFSSLDEGKGKKIKDLKINILQVVYMYVYCIKRNNFNYYVDFLLYVLFFCICIFCVGF